MEMTAWMTALRQDPELERRVPLESALSLPVPLRCAGRLCLRLFAYGRQGRAPDGRIPVYRPHARLTADAETARVVEFADLDAGDGVAGYYPHLEMAGLDYAAARALRAELLALTGAVLPLFGRTDLTVAERETVRRYAARFRQVTEPCLRDYYAALNPEFFAWLQQEGGA